MLNEIVIISGKGGTGKTSVTAAFAALAGRSVLADCDVDAADLHLVLSPQIRERHDFYSGHVAVIRPDDCSACGTCMVHCRFDAISRTLPAEGDDEAHGTLYHCQTCDYCKRSCPAQIDAAIEAMAEATRASQRCGFRVDPIACEGCGVCVWLCPEKAIDFPERLAGEWYVSETRCGPMVHAKLGIAQSNSGKLVSVVRQHARRIAEERKLDRIIVDGSPGIGCPVIASVTGADLVLTVTEPTLSGEHDLKRVVQLSRHFGIAISVCINKWDLNPDVSARIEAYCHKESIALAGRIRYDKAFTQAQLEGRTVVEAGEIGVGEDIRQLWTALRTQLEPSPSDAA